MPTGFNSTLHEYRLGDPAAITKKSVNIFVGSMADVFGDWVPDSWIEKVFEACAAAPWHHYLFLTKNPARYVQLEEAGRLPKAPNMWYGVTASNAAEWDAYQIMGELPTQYKTFVSIEPLQEDITETQCWQDMMATWPWMDWVIIGAERGNRKEKVIPKREWVGAIIAQCEVTARPVFLKDNIAGVWGGEPIQEFPKGLLPRPKPRPRHQVKIEAVRDAKDCDSCGTHLQGKPAYRLGARKYECVSCFEKLEAESWQNLQK